MITSGRIAGKRLCLDSKAEACRIVLSAHLTDLMLCLDSKAEACRMVVR